jgi:hypothetical protein
MQLTSQNQATYEESGAVREKNGNDGALIQVITNVWRAVLFVVLALLGLVPPAVAQTCQWSSLGPGTNSGVYALTSFDDGTGPALYAAGLFTTAGFVTARGVAKWNGADWSAPRQRREQYRVRVDGLR